MAVVTTNAEKSAEAEVADCEPVEAKGRIICNVNQECMSRAEKPTSRKERNVKEPKPTQEIGVIGRERKLRKTEDETN